MELFVRNRLQNCIIAGVIMMMLFGCAGTKETVSQKYAASKSWFKEKWHSADSKSSSSEDEEKSIKSDRINYFEHRVKWSGETLSLIAKWYTGSYGNWKAIAQANSGLNPNRGWRYHQHSAGNDEDPKSVAPQSGLQNPSGVFCAYSDPVERKNECHCPLVHRECGKPQGHCQGEPGY